MTAAAVPLPHGGRGEFASRLGTHHVLVVFGGVLAALAVAALIAVLLLRPDHAGPPCSFGQPCPPPQETPRAARGTPWASSLGMQVEYDGGTWSPVSKSSDTIILGGDGGYMEVITRKSTDYHSLYRDEVASLKGKFNLVASHDPVRTLLGPNVGYQPGIGGVYCGNGTSNQGGTIPVDTIAMAASKDGVSAFVALITPDCSKTDNPQKSPFDAPELGDADVFLNTFRWPSEIR